MAVHDEKGNRLEIESGAVHVVSALTDPLLYNLVPRLPGRVSHHKPARPLFSALLPPLR
jgi:hypothetical protein